MGRELCPSEHRPWAPAGATLPALGGARGGAGHEASRNLSPPGEFIIGRVIKAMNNNWHPGCFRCELCDVELADLGFVKNAGR